MSGFLDQSEIDRLQYELAVLTSKKQLALEAKDKIKTMYFDIVKAPLMSSLENLDEIREAINQMEIHIKQDSKYKDSLFSLKASYQKRTHG